MRSGGVGLRRGCTAWLLCFGGRSLQDRWSRGHACRLARPTLPCPASFFFPGEGHRQDIDDIVAAALEYYGEKGQLDDTPLPVALERDRDPRLAASPLRFPGASLLLTLAVLSCVAGA